MVGRLGSRRVGGYYHQVPFEFGKCCFELLWGHVKTNRVNQQSKLKQYTKDRLQQLNMAELGSKSRVRRTSAKHSFMPPRLANVNGRLVNAENRTVQNYRVLGHRPMPKAYVVTFPKVMIVRRTELRSWRLGRVRRIMPLESVF